MDTKQVVVLLSLVSFFVYMSSLLAMDKFLWKMGPLSDIIVQVPKEGDILLHAGAG